MPLLLSLARRIDAVNEQIGRLAGWGIPLAIVVAALYAVARAFLSDTDNDILNAVFNQRANAWFEIQWFLFSAVFLLGAAYTLRRNEHVRIDVVAGRLSRRAQVWIDLFGFVLFLLPMCAIVVYYALPYALLSLRSGETGNAGGLALWPAKALIVAGFVLLGLQGISEIIKRAGYLAGRVGEAAFERQPANAPGHGDSGTGNGTPT